MTAGYFISGTDTGVGKTRITVALVRSLGERGLLVAAMKPIASGCQETAQGLRNDDALQLQTAANIAVPYQMLNPYAFAPPIAPHIAASQEGVIIDIQYIVSCFEQLATQAQRVIVEGVGGWQVPLNEAQTTADLARALGLPVILVVGLRLGCINHTLLSCEAIRQSGLPLAGWVANHVEADIACSDEIIATLQQRLQAPLLGEVPFDSVMDATAVAEHLDVSGL